jgi:hypothetical protein
MTSGGAKVGSNKDAVMSPAALPDLALAGDALKELHRLWGSRGPEPVTVYLGVDSHSGRVHVGWIRDVERKAVRFSGRTIELAMEMARVWTRTNPTRAGH